MTVRESLSPVVEAFIIEHFASVEHIEVLVFVLERQDREWDAESIGRHLRRNPVSVARRLEDLKDKNFIASSGEPSKGVYRYRPASPELDAVLRGIADSYKTMHVRIIDLIYGRPDKIRVFSDAFKIRKD